MMGRKRLRALGEVPHTLRKKRESVWGRVALASRRRGGDIVDLRVVGLRCRCFRVGTFAWESNPLGVSLPSVLRWEQQEPLPLNNKTEVTTVGVSPCMVLSIYLV